MLVSEEVVLISVGEAVTVGRVALTWGMPRMAFGGDYNPEQWPEPVWAEDVELMGTAGVNFVTVGVFAWARLEPRPGEFAMDWLARVLDLLHDAGIRVDLATGTASPPPWLARLHPEIVPVDDRGARYALGSRQTWCPSSPVYREHSLVLVDRLAKEFGGHPALTMWHVSNELGCHNARCYCPVSAAHFRRWLEHRYGDLAELNRAWGTTFWSQAYSDWDEIQAPGRSTTFSNPTQLLDFARFSSDALRDQFVAERDLLREYTPTVPVTTNFIMSHEASVDCFSWASELDLIANDHYVLGALPDPLAHLAFVADLTRGVAGGQPWLLMEHSTSAVNWQPVNRAKPPGEMMRTSLGHVARGADGVAFFQWRAAQAGSEKFHSALVPHAGADTERFREVAELGAVVDRLSELRGSTVEADVALLFDWPSVWATNAPSLPSSLVRGTDAARAYHRVLRGMGVTVDVVHPHHDLSSYRVVIVPTLYLCDDRTAAAVAEAAAGGAHVVVTYFSGIVDEEDHVRLGGYPGAFRELVGVMVEEFFPLAPDETIELSDGSRAGVWSERVRLTPGDGAEVVAEHTAAPLAGVPAITVRRVDAGAAWYVAAALDDASLGRLLGRVTSDAGVAPVAAASSDGSPNEVDVTRRRGPDGSWLFVLNHGAHDVSLDVSGHELVSDRTIEGVLTVGAGHCAVVREAPGA
jgi:beta-galactosidase